MVARERLAQQRVVEQVDLPDRQVVRGPPPLVDAGHGVGVDHRAAPGLPRAACRRRRAHARSPVVVPACHRRGVSLSVGRAARTRVRWSCVARARPLVIQPHSAHRRSRCGRTHAERPVVCRHGSLRRSAGLWADPGGSAAVPAGPVLRGTVRRDRAEPRSRRARACGRVVRTRASATRRTAAARTVRPPVPAWEQAERRPPTTMLRAAVRPRMLVLLVLLLAAAALCARLGAWQLDRAQVHGAAAAERHTAELVAAAAVPLDDVLVPQTTFTGDLVGRKVAVTGTYDADGQLLVTGRAHDGTTGLLVLTPLTTTDGAVLPVVRGLGGDARRRRRPTGRDRGRDRLPAGVRAGGHRGGRRADRRDQLRRAAQLLGRTDLHRLPRRLVVGPGAGRRRRCSTRRPSPAPG